MRPHSGVGGGAPEPEEAERRRGQDGGAHADRGAHDDGEAMLGSTCRVITRNGEAPSAIADSMKTSFFSERVSANTRRAQNGQ